MKFSTNGLEDYFAGNPHLGRAILAVLEAANRADDIRYQVRWMDPGALVRAQPSRSADPRDAGPSMEVVMRIPGWDVELLFGLRPLRYHDRRFADMLQCEFLQAIPADAREARRLERT